MIFDNFLENKLQRWNEIIRNQPQEPKFYIQRGMVNFKLARIDESVQDFDTAEQLDEKLKPYLWQRGLAYYYAERFVEGAEQFEIDLIVNPQDVEETVWRYLCIARIKGVEEAQNTFLSVKNDPRQIMQNIYELYAGSCAPYEFLTISNSQGKHGKFYAYLYLGLYYEVHQNIEKASEYILQAAKEYKIDDYMWHLANVHINIRQIKK